MSGAVERGRKADDERGEWSAQHGGKSIACGTTYLPDSRQLCAERRQLCPPRRLDEAVELVDHLEAPLDLALVLLVAAVAIVAGTVIIVLPIFARRIVAGPTVGICRLFGVFAPLKEYARKLDNLVGVSGISEGGV